MAIPKISYLPTIVAENPTHVDTDTRSHGVTEESGLPPPNWLQRLWSILSLIYTHWNQISSIPLDLYLGALFTRTPPDCQESTKVSQVVDHGDKSTIGQLALHPILSLLAVCALDSSEVLFYHTETAQFLWKSPVKLPKTTSNDDATVPSTVACLRFSTANKLAVGLNNGIVCVLEQDLSTRVQLYSHPQKEETTTSYQVINLLPLSSSSINAKYLGRVTNLAFSPTGDIMPNKENCLAIATQKSGVWIWNQNTKQAIRVINTAGVNDDCMHWISLSEGPKELQKPKTPIVEEKQLGASAIQKFASIFGGADSLTKLDEYFAPSTATVSSAVQPSPQALHRATGISSAVSPATGMLRGPSWVESTKSHHGESLLIFGTKTGNIRVQKLWHSRSMMRLETFTEFSPTAFAQPQGRLQSISGPASGEITHLAILPHALTSSEVTIPILSTFSSDKSTTTHRFSVSVLLEELPSRGWQTETREIGTTILISLVNLLLLGTRYRWLNAFNSTFSNPSLITHHTAHAILPFTPPSAPKIFTTSPPKASQTSISALHLSNIILATLDSKTPHRPNLSQCIILAPSIHDHSSPLTPLAAITPPLPVPRHLTQKPPPPQGYYTQQLARAGITTPPSRITEDRRRTKWSAVEFCEHKFTCGQVAWAKGTRGSSVGAFLYQPASTTEMGLGVCLFEVEDQ